MMAIWTAPAAPGVADPRDARCEYVAGEDRRSSLLTVRRLAAAGGVRCNIGELLPAAADAAEAAANADGYRALASALGDTPEGTWLEVDLPHLGVGLDRELCAEALRGIGAELPPGRQIQVGAEDSSLTDAVLGAVMTARRDGVPLRATLQANLRRSLSDADALIAAGVPLRIVKGGFPEPPDIAWRFGEETDLAFLRLARRALHGASGVTLATHDAVIQQALLGESAHVCVEMLFGVRPGLARRLASAGHAVRLYVPFGREWEPYVAKRLEAARRHGGAR